MLFGFQILLASVAVAAIAKRSLGARGVAIAVACAALDLPLDGAPGRGLALAARDTAPLVLFLTSAIWLADLAAWTGLVERVAAALARAARGRKPLLYALVCAVCAALTAAVSLDGAVVLMVPLVLSLARRTGELRHPLLMGTIAVANASSLAVPQGNPTNIVLAERLGLSPGAFVSHLLLPAMLASALCATAAGIAGRRVLRGRYNPELPQRSRLSGDERFAVAALVAAGAAPVAAMLLGVAPWWSICGVAAVALTATRALGRPTPSPRVPWAVAATVGALLVLLAPLAHRVPHAAGDPASPGVLLAIALGAAAAAAAVNNLPASLVVAGLLGRGGLAPYAALTGLSVGSLASPHGSVATMIAFDRAGTGSLEGHARVWLPVAAAATVAATVCIWLLA